MKLAIRLCTLIVIAGISTAAPGDDAPKPPACFKHVTVYVDASEPIFNPRKAADGSEFRPIDQINTALGHFLSVVMQPTDKLTIKSFSNGVKQEYDKPWSNGPVSIAREVREGASQTRIDLVIADMAEALESPDEQMLVIASDFVHDNTDENCAPSAGRIADFDHEFEKHRKELEQLSNHKRTLTLLQVGSSSLDCHESETVRDHVLEALTPLTTKLVEDTSVAAIERALMDSVKAHIGIDIRFNETSRTGEIALQNPTPYPVTVDKLTFDIQPASTTIEKPTRLASCAGATFELSDDVMKSLEDQTEVSITPSGPGIEATTQRVDLSPLLVLDAKVLYHTPRFGKDMALVSTTIRSLVRRHLDLTVGAKGFGAPAMEFPIEVQPGDTTFVFCLPNPTSAPPRAAVEMKTSDQSRILTKARNERPTTPAEPAQKPADTNPTPGATAPAPKPAETPTEVPTTQTHKGETARHAPTFWLLFILVFLGYCAYIGKLENARDLAMNSAYAGHFYDVLREGKGVLIALLSNLGFDILRFPGAEAFGFDAVVGFLWRELILIVAIVVTVRRIFIWRWIGREVDLSQPGSMADEMRRLRIQRLSWMVILSLIGTIVLYQYQYSPGTRIPHGKLVASNSSSPQ